MILVVDNGSTSLSSLVEVLRFLGTEFEIKAHSELPKIAPFSGLIISGRAVASRESNRNNSAIIEAAESRDIPTLGICYGAEIIATTFGGTLRRLENHARENRLVTVFRRNPVLTEKTYSAYESHGYKIFRLPPSFESLARSPVSDNEAIRRKRLLIFGTQFHPELSGNSGKAIIRNFVKQCADSSDPA